MKSRTYYDILEVDPSADSKAIRQAYLRQSLKHHPDKNLSNVEEAKARFVEIGQAYETLSDSELRAQYNNTLRRSHGRECASERPCEGNFGSKVSPESYENYRNTFDETVASMSEDELAAALGVVSIVGSLVGSLIGSRLGNRAGGRTLATGFSLAGSMIASRMAGDAFLSIHQESIARVAYKKECQRCVEQGLPMPEPPPVKRWQLAVEKTVTAVKAKIEQTRSCC